MSTLFSKELSEQIAKELLNTLGLTVSNVVLEGMQRSIEFYLWKAYEIGRENGLKDVDKK